MPFRISIHETNVVERIIEELTSSLRGHVDSPLGNALLLHRLQRVEEKLDRVLINQAEAEEKLMATAQEIIDRVVRENTETKQELAKLLTTTQEAVTTFATWPDKVKAAIQEALANNPGVDLSALSGVADEMDANQATIDSAQQALQAAIETANAPAPTPATPEPEPEPLEAQPEVPPAGGSESGAI